MQYFNLLICWIITLIFNVRFVSIGLYRNRACCEYPEMLKVPSMNATLYRAAVTSSYRLTPRKLYTTNTKFYVLLTVQLHPNPANRQSTEKHNTYQLLYIYSIPPNDGLQICPKHVEIYWRNKLRINSASSWFSLHRLNTQFRPYSIFFNTYGFLNKAFLPPKHNLRIKICNVVLQGRSEFKKIKKLEYSGDAQILWQP
jgi:hypothetical protein